MKNKEGFTYLEMIIVIAVIGLLASFGISTYPGVQKTARDSQRKSDLKQYHTALEKYANNKGGFYPSRTIATPASDLTGTPNLCGDLSMSQCPADPHSNKNDCMSGVCNYYYRSNGSGAGTANATQFVLYGMLEKDIGYWVYCSNGSSGVVGATTDFSSGICPF